MNDDDKFFEMQAEEWIKKAGEDELSAKSILKHRDGSPSTVCFISHQMAEKYLKAFLVEKTHDYPKIHLLDVLAELCVKNDKNSEQIKEEAVFLNAFYIPARYPADYPEFSWHDAEEAYAAAEKIKDFVSKKIKKQV